jgi:hypothetical protein
MRAVKCFNNRIEKAWEHKGMRICTATHPDYPNWNGKSRGRKCHLAKDHKLTVCNMLVDEYIPESDKNWSMVSNGFCKTCFKGEEPSGY